MDSRGMPLAEVSVETMLKLTSFCETCERTGVKRNLLTCSGCRKAKYCNKRCQSADWQGHKDICLRDQEETQRLISLGQVEGYERMSIKTGARITNKWARVYTGVLGHMSMHGLKLPLVRSFCSTHVLIITLRPTFPPNARHQKDVDIASAFEVVDAVATDARGSRRIGKDLYGITASCLRLASEDISPAGYMILYIPAMKMRLVYHDTWAEYKKPTQMNWNWKKTLQQYIAHRMCDPRVRVVSIPGHSDIPWHRGIPYWR